MSHKHCYSSLTHPSMKEAISLHNYSALKLAILVAEFAQQIAAAYEHVSKEIQTITTTFRRRNYELKKERPTDTSSTISTAWESLLQETEMDAQAHLDVASLLIKNVYKPLDDVASHKGSQGQKLCTFRENFENLLEDSEKNLSAAEARYYSCYEAYKEAEDEERRDRAKADLYNAHNSYVLQLRASNRIADEFHKVIPQVLEELEEIYIDTSNTINVAIETHALLLLTKANEQHRKFDDLLHICRQVNPQMDVSHFVKSTSSDLSGPDISSHHFHPVEDADDVEDVSNTEVAMKNQLIVDRYTENSIRSQLVELQNEAMQLTVFIKQKQDATNTLINVCQRNLANHMYAKVYETQEDMCRKRNEIRIANMRLAGVRAQIEMLTPKQNGAVVQDQEDDESHHTQSSAIKGMWKKAFKNLKSNEKQNWLTKKGSLIKRKDSGRDQGQEDLEAEICKEIDPVYSLLKCAADLPKAGKSVCSISSKHSSHDSSGNTSKTSSPSSSASHSPKTRRKKLNSRMKSFSLDTPEAPKQLLAIDENTKKKSSSFTNTYFGEPSLSSLYLAASSPPSFTAPQSPVKTRRKKLNSRMKSFSLDAPDAPTQLLPIDENTKKKSRSFNTYTCFGEPTSPSDIPPQTLMKTQRKKLNIHMKSHSLDIPRKLHFLSPDETSQKKTRFIFSLSKAVTSPVEMTISAAGARKKMGFNMRSSSLEIEETKKRNSSLSPLHSPKSKGKDGKDGKDPDIYVVLYNFRGKEKDDMDLRAGWRLAVTNSSNPDWWKGKCNGKVGYFPSTYVQKLQPSQRIFQVLQTMNLAEKELGFGMRLHKDQIVFQVGEEADEMIHVQAPNKKQAMCPVKYLKEV